MVRCILDIRNKKELVFLELKQGSMVVAYYEAKFEGLLRYSPHYNGAGGEK